MFLHFVKVNKIKGFNKNLCVFGILSKDQQQNIDYGGEFLVK